MKTKSENRFLLENELFNLYRGYGKDYRTFPDQYAKVKEEIKARGIKISRERKEMMPDKVVFERVKLFEFEHGKEAKKFISEMTDDELNEQFGAINSMQTNSDYYFAKIIYRHLLKLIKKENDKEQRLLNRLNKFK